MKLKFLSLILLITIIFVSSCDKISSNNCTTENSILTSVEIIGNDRKIVGFNADTDSLKFGKVTPTATVKRSVNVEYNKNAQVTIKTEGTITDWIIIEPAEFLITPENNVSVTFKLVVPEDIEGNYTGNVNFCFKE